ncbi:MAG: PH domain-containing protein [Clostridiaceae bacterium]|nr:PH domain-containing protein [Clostridiaceae bacterium]
MKIIRRRSSFVTVIDNTWKGVIGFTVIIALELIENGVSSSLKYIALFLALVVALIIFLFQFIRWRITYFIYDGETVILEKTGIFKKKLTVPVDKISTVDIKKNILGHLTGTSRVKIDSGGKQIGNDNSGVEINLIFDDLFARQIKALIFKKEIEMQTQTFRMSGKDLVIDGLLRRKLIYAIPFFISIYVLATAVLNEKTVDSITSKALMYIKSLEFFVILILAVIFIIFTNITSIVKELIKYHNFTLQKQKDVIVTSFGLFTTQNYSLPLEKIRAVILQQNTLSRLLGYYTISVACIGLGDEKDEKPVIFPLATKERMISILSMIDPAMAAGEQVHKVPKRGRIFYYLPLAIYLILLLTVFAATKLLFQTNVIYFIGPVLVLPILLVSAFLSLKNAGLSYNENYVKVTNGIFVKTTTIIPVRHIQSVGMMEPFYKRKKNLCNLHIKFYPGFTNPSLSSFDMMHFAAIAELLEKG